MFPVIRARGGRALVLTGIVGVGVGIGCWIAMLLGVTSWIAGAIGGGVGYSAAYVADRWILRRS